MAMLNESNKGIGSIPSVSGLPAAGLAPDSPGSAAALTAEMKKRGGFRDTLQGGVRGAAAGINAAQGALSPMAAFVQGMSAGMQIPGQMAQEKAKQLDDTIKASPFQIAYPDMFNDLVAKYPDLKYLGGIPTGLVLPTMAAMAQEGAKAHAEGVEQRENEKYKKELEGISPKIDYKLEQDMALDFNKLPEVVEYKQIKGNYNQALTAPLKTLDQKTGLQVINGAGQLQVITAFIKSINPQAKFSADNISAADVGSEVNKHTIELYNKVFNGAVAGEDEINKMMASMRSRYKGVLNKYRKVADIWGDRAEERGMNSTFVLSGDTGSGESADDIYTAISAQHPGMSEREVFAIMKSQGY